MLLFAGLFKYNFLSVNFFSLFVFVTYSVSIFFLPVQAYFYYMYIAVQAEEIISNIIINLYEKTEWHETDIRSNVRKGAQYRCSSFV